MRKILIKSLKIFAVSILAVLLAMLLFPILFPGKIEKEIKSFANQNLNGELNFKEANLSFFNHFPSLTLSLNEFSLKGSEPFKNDTLVAANEIAFGINLKDLLFDKKVTIDEIYLSEAFMNVKVNKNGEANYNVYVSDKKKVSKDTSSTAIRLDKIEIKNSHLVYDDKSTKILINAKGFNYFGKGDLDKAIFDLKTEAKIDDFNFTFNEESYLKNKKVNADLITKINTTSLSFLFQENNLKVNKLPIEFVGKLDFLKNGYALDFKIESQNSKLNDFFTALPPSYVTWLEKTKVKGTADLLLTLKGKYIASSNQKPDLAFNMKIREGEINHKEAPIPATNIFLNFDTKLPSLNTEKLRVNIDSIYFNVGKDYVKAIIKSNGLSKPNIDATIKTQINLAELDKALGIQNMDLKGQLNLDVKSKGVFDTKNKIVPVTKGNILFKNGYIKTDYYPNAITNIMLSANVLDNTGLLKDLKVDIKPASFTFEGKPVYVAASLENLENVKYDIKAKGELDLAKIYKVFSKKGLDLKGFIKADVALKGTQADAVAGNYKNLDNKGTLLLRNIKTTSEYLPKPFVIKEGVFTFKQDKMNFKDFKAVYGQSDFKMDGYMQNVIDFVLSPKGVLKGSFNVNANYINVDEFMSNSVKNGTQNQTSVEVQKGVVVIPPNLNLQFNCNALKVDFEELKIQNLKGNVTINEGKLQLKKSGFDIIGSNINMNIVYGNESTSKAFFEIEVAAKEFDVKRAYNEVKMFREMASAAENAEGIISLDYKVKGKLNDLMQPIYPSLVGGGILSVKDVKMKGFKMFNAVSKRTGKDRIKNPNLTKVDIKTTIKNNIITLERFKFKVAGFRPRIEGTTSFDGKLNFKMRLGLPPLGIIGIPLTITGTQDNPKVKLGRKGEDIEETEYKETTP
ncbi:AsmA-like C-terminal region-containing protein [Flavobacterium sp.]|uniref:AsmA-like C-terminal region-containing protein n=1 Tax=Flavobacterium sp. TaxID=239 RepID=UPI00260BCB98|nr:AsmA-like C-terminal region-containing protein [Flavobacterium sp.]